MSFAKLKTLKKYKRNHSYKVNDVKDKEGFVLSAWYNSFNPKTKTLTMPLIVGHDMTRIVNEKENWYLWNALKTEHYDKIIQIQHIKMGPGLTIVPDKAFENRVINFGYKKYGQQFTSVDMSTSNIMVIGKEAFIGNSSLESISLSKHIKVLGEMCFAHTNVSGVKIDKPLPIVYFLQPQLNHMLALDYVPKEYAKFITTGAKENSVLCDFPISDDNTFKIEPLTNKIDFVNLEKCNCVIHLRDDYMIQNSPLVKSIIKNNIKYTYASRFQLDDDFAGKGYSFARDLHMKNLTGDSSMFYCDNLMKQMVKSRVGVVDLHKYVISLTEECVNASILAYNSMTALDRKPRTSNEVTKETLTYLTNYVNRFLTNPNDENIEYDCHWNINYDIPDKAFMGCTNLKRMHINRQVNVGKYAFMDSGLKYFGGCYQSLAPYALQGTDITQLRLPETCNAVGYKAIMPKVKVIMTQQTKDKIKQIKLNEDQIEITTPTYGRIKY